MLLLALLLMSMCEEQYLNWLCGNYFLYAFVVLLVTSHLLVGSTAQSVLCQPIVQSNGDLVGK